MIFFILTPSRGTSAYPIIPPTDFVGTLPERFWTTTQRCRLHCRGVIFKRVGDGRPYPDHGATQRDWAQFPPRPIRLDQLVTTKRTLDLDTLLAEDSTYYGDLFAHVVEYRQELYLEDGLHRALRAALHQRMVLHARVLRLEG
jgi:Arc/MetJ family transcription regulator